MFLLLTLIKYYTINGSIDPDNNLHNRVNLDSLYYTDDEFNTKVVPKSEGSSNFSIIHFNTRSMAANFNKLKACIDYKFDVIAISETWMNDNESEEYQLEIIMPIIFLDNTELVVGLLYI